MEANLQCVDGRSISMEHEKNVVSTLLKG